jgi:nicotinate-nucleotide adenylyltransferase
MAQPGPPGLLSLRGMSGSPDRAIALYGGTFDPVHFGHLRTALEVHELLQLEDFRLLPAGIPAHRSNRITAAHHRLAMLELAIAEMTEFTIDQREIAREGKSYMVDTLAEFREEAGDIPLLLILGQDSANTLDSWHYWPDILDLAHLVIMNRSGDSVSYSQELSRSFEGKWVESPDDLMQKAAGCLLNARVSHLSISSSRIRSLFRNGQSSRFLLPDAVLDYIEKNQIYC